MPTANCPLALPSAQIIQHDQQSKYFQGLLQQVINQENLSDSQLKDVNGGLCAYDRPYIIDVCLDIAAALDDINGILPGLENLFKYGPTQITDQDNVDDILCSALEIILDQGTPDFCMKILDAAARLENVSVNNFLIENLCSRNFTVPDVRLNFAIQENFPANCGITLDYGDDCRKMAEKIEARFTQLTQSSGPGPEIVCIASVFYGGGPHLKENDRITVALNNNDIHGTLRAAFLGIAPLYDLTLDRTRQGMLYRARLKEPVYV